eukprot:scaffold1863_cov166-Ochromonas_danica.AAC.2
MTDITTIFFQLLLVFLTIESLGCTSFREEELVLTLPWPSGIIIDRLQDPVTKQIYRFGRLQHNAISLRPAWSSIYVLPDVVTKQQVEDVLRRTEDHVAKKGWMSHRHVDYDVRPTQDLPLHLLYDKESEEWKDLIGAIHGTIFKAMATHYNLSADLLYIDDLFITKYDSSPSLLDERNQLALHEDKSPWTFVLALNDNFEGGGTYFASNRDKLYHPKATGVLIFHGRQPHGAMKITSGSRYILAGFCEYGSADGLEHFLLNYDPRYDGLAAENGFQTGDLIIGIEVCSLTGEGVERRMINVEDVNDEEWVALAQSCEILTPGKPTVLRVRRAVRVSPQESLVRTVDFEGRLATEEA